jgi:hypothetical protein
MKTLIVFICCLVLFVTPPSLVLWTGGGLLEYSVFTLTLVLKHL